MRSEAICFCFTANGCPLFLFLYAEEVDRRLDSHVKGIGYFNWPREHIHNLASTNARWWNATLYLITDLKYDKTLRHLHLMS